MIIFRQDTPFCRIFCDLAETGKHKDRELSEFVRILPFSDKYQTIFVFKSKLFGNHLDADGILRYNEDDFRKEASAVQQMMKRWIRLGCVRCQGKELYTAA